MLCYTGATEDSVRQLFPYTLVSMRVFCPFDKYVFNIKPEDIVCNGLILLLIRPEKETRVKNIHRINFSVAFPLKSYTEEIADTRPNGTRLLKIKTGTYSRSSGASTAITSTSTL